MVRMLVPDALWLLFLVPSFWVAYMWALIWKRRWLTAYGGDIRPRPELGRMVLLSLAVGCAVLGLARLQYLSLGEECVRPGIDIAYGVDVSVSMLAEDTEFPALPAEDRPPNRLERVRQAVLAITDRLGGEQVGLFLFASDAAPVLPPSPDYENLRFFAEHYLDAWNLSARGTNLLSALRMGGDVLDTEAQYKVLVLFTDGEHERAEEMNVVVERARELRVESGVRVYTVGVGSPSYSPIPLRGASRKVEGYMRNAEGELVKTRMEGALLERIAHVGGGRAYLLGRTDISRQLVGDILRGATRIPLLTRPAMRAKELSPYFYLAAVFLLVGKELVWGLRRLQPVRSVWPVLRPFGSSSPRRVV